ncbi:MULTISPECIES: AI-2E family transporter [unclassified Exiguobacterium]|uniref:AI-2E family transporter n=1 Tax=unclassified Exiguobacterium TaxID=2644629 RepID=UPI000B5977B0|nr:MULTISPECIES: AI-2E family transporter [unclassified Exiguobacterium]ASI36463.1 AI-2E family transporter [Exiguobacterium sp. N4-1P]
MQKMFENKWYRGAWWVMTLLVIVWVGNHVTFLFRPLAILGQMVVPPLAIAGILYYVLLPIVEMLEKKMSRRPAVMVVLFGLIGIMTALGFIFGPSLSTQISEFVNSIPNLATEFQRQLVEVRSQLENSSIFSRFVGGPDDLFDKFSTNLSEYASSFLKNVGAGVGGFVSLITTTVITIIIIPIMLIYMLLDGHKLKGNLVNMMPFEFHKETKKILEDVHETIMSYIRGQVIVSIGVGIIAYIGYLFIGIDYAILLAMFATLTNIIPFLGPVIGVIPALIVGFIQDPILAIYAIIVMTVAQQIDSHIMSPLVQGRTLDVHPLTIIIVLLVAGNIAGFFGVLLGVPFYAVMKVIILNLQRLYHLRTQKKMVITDEEKTFDTIITKKE